MYLVPDGSKLALIIGIDSYRNNLEPLLSCRKDARDIAELLSRPEFNYTIFRDKPLIGSELDDKYGWADVHEAIFQFFGEAKPGQRLLFYFSGHGIPGDNDVYLSTPQIDPKNPRRAGVTLSELTKGMDSSKSRDILGIIDACYSGSAELPDLILKKKSAKNDAARPLAAYDRVWKNIPKSKAIYLMLSSQSYAPSNALEGSNSLYTQFLLEGMRGIKPHMSDENGHVIEYSGSIEENGEVTPQSLHDYVYHKVANITDQVPMLRSTQSRRFAIVNYPQLAKTAQTSQRDYLVQLLTEKVDEFNEIRKKENYPKLDFGGIDLRRKKLKLINLEGINLSDARLTYADLSKSKLSEADLSNARLLGAKLSEADLSNANLSGTELSYSDLSGANLSSSIIIGVKLVVKENKIYYPQCANAKFDGATIIDDQGLRRHFYTNGSKSVPPAVKNKKELREKLEKRGLDRETINRLLSLSSLPDS